ncbi:MAG: hypothetical protein ACLFUZ_02665 [Candidatus Micrarchaeia archaeon]
MLAVEGLKMIVGLCALSLLVFALVPGMGDLLVLAKMLAASFGASLLFVLLYPYLRGVRKGDRVQVVRGAISQFFGFTGIAMENCRKGKEVKVKLSRGREAVGVVERYEGLFTLPQVKLLYENKGEVMR